MINLTAKSQLKQLFVLAIPLSIGQAGNILANMVDSAMLGKYNSTHMLACTLGFEVFVIPFILLIGISIGMTSTIAQEDGEGKKPNIFGSAMLTHLIAALAIGILIYASTFFLEYLHPDAHVRELSKPYIYLMAISMIPIAIFLTLKQFLEGFGLTLVATISSLLANALNVLFNYWFIFGHLGFTPMGIVGAGYATLLSKVMAIVIVLIFIFMLKNHKNKFVKSEFGIYKRKCLSILKIGLPIGFQMFIEVTAFTVAGIFIGYIGNAALGAHTIALQYAGLTYLLVTGVGSAATIMAGNYLGEGNRAMLHLLIKNVLILAIIYEVFSGLVFYILSPYMPDLYLNKSDTQMYAIAIVLIQFAAVFQIPDGIQSALQGILRGLKDVKLPMWIAGFVHYAFTLFGGYVLAFYFGYGVYGMWMGFVLGLTILAILLYIRLKYVAKLLDKSIFANKL
jgi:MATE family multidrug resistance protein